MAAMSRGGFHPSSTHWVNTVFDWKEDVNITRIQPHVVSRDPFVFSMSADLHATIPLSHAHAASSTVSSIIPPLASHNNRRKGILQMMALLTSYHSSSATQQAPSISCSGSLFSQFLRAHSLTNDFQSRTQQLPFPSTHPNTHTHTHTHGVLSRVSESGA